MKSGTATSTLAGFLREIAARFPERTALVMRSAAGEQRVTYRQLADVSDRVAISLAHLGIRRGDTVVLWLPNVFEYVMLFFGATKLGACVIGLNTRYRAAELRSVLESAQPTAIALIPQFLNIDFIEMLRAQIDVVPALKHVISVKSPFDDAEPSVPHDLPCIAYADLDAVVAGAQVAEASSAEDAAIVFTTSGTTAAPKLAAHDHASIVRHAFSDARGFEIHPADAILGYLPFCGVFGFSTLMGCLAAGATCVVQPVFKSEEALDLMQRYRVTHVNGSDIFLEALLAVPNVDDGRLRHFRYGAHADFSGKLLDKFEALERRIGTRLTSTYGSSECFALMARWPQTLSSAERCRGGGIVVDEGIQFRVVDPNTGHSLDHGTAGELQFKGYNVFQRYLNNLAATEAAFTHDGWFRSGDLGYTIDARSFVYLSRLNDSLRLHGYLVDPREIEAFLETHPGIAMAQVIGLESEHGAIPVAFVKAREGAIDPDAILDYCRSHIAAYKIPRAVLFIDTFPTTESANGVKIQKGRLRDIARERLGFSPERK